MLASLGKSLMGLKGGASKRLARSFHTSKAMRKEMTVREALGTAISEEIERDEKVFLIGEEVGQYNGAYKVSKGLYDKFGGGRVVDTPISEMGFTGIGVGAAMMGLKPIVEFMTWNFAMQAIDQIVNSAAKGRYMSGGDLQCPIVFRGLNGAAKGVAAQHSQCFAPWYSSVPGLKVVSIYDGEDARGLLKAAVRDPNPVVVLENEMMYSEIFDLSEKVLDKDFVIPIGKLKVAREGKHVTIATFARQVGLALKAAAILEKEGISAEVLNLRTLRPLDRDGIVKSVKKTTRLVTLEEAWPQCGIGAELCALMMESSCFDYLDSPVVRVTGLDVPCPYAENLENLVLPQVENIVNAARKACYGAKL